MSSQIFKTPVPEHILFDFLDKICSDTERYYLIDTNVFKKMKYHKYFDDFSYSIKDNYHISKQFYLTRKLTYNSFTNIIRQICKSLGNKTVSAQKYNDSDYIIELHVYPKK